MANSDFVTLDTGIDARLNLLGAEAFDGILPPQMGANFDGASLGNVGANFDETADIIFGGNNFG